MKQPLPISFLFLLSTCMQSVVAQKAYNWGDTKIHLLDSGRQIVAEILPLKKRFAPKPSRLYYWYANNRIQKTQGGYSGKILQGNYTEYWPNKNVKEQGEFYHGLKNKEWKYWNEYGFLWKRITWTEGEKNGPFETYDATGNVLTKGFFDHDRITGRWLQYGKNDSISRVHYKEGKILPEKGPGSFWHSLNLFKRHKEDSTEASPH